MKIWNHFSIKFIFKIPPGSYVEVIKLHQYYRVNHRDIQIIPNMYVSEIVEHDNCITQKKVDN